jgi:hypothetical protein
MPAVAGMSFPGVTYAASTSGAPFLSQTLRFGNFMTFCPPLRQDEARVLCTATRSQVGNHGSADSEM